MITAELLKDFEAALLVLKRENSERLDFVHSVNGFLKILEQANKPNSGIWSEPPVPPDPSEYREDAGAFVHIFEKACQLNEWTTQSPHYKLLKPIAEHYAYVHNTPE